MANTLDMTKIYISQADLFLLDKWQETSPLSTEAQREQIFTEYLKLGIRGREPYNTKNLGGRTANHLPLHSQERLYSIRPLKFTQPPKADVYWLRTCYERKYEEAWQKLREEHLDGLIKEDGIFNDARYDFGKDWARIFLLWPELLYSGQTAEDYEEEVKEALDEVIDVLNEVNEARMEEENEDDSDDGLYVNDLCFSYHKVVATGRIHVVDKVTLSSKGRDAGKVLIVFFDECGRVVRYSRAEPHYAAEMTALSNCYLDDHACWANAEIGEDYEWDGELGLPFAEESEADES